MRHLADRRGSSLIEVSVAVAILAIALPILYSFAASASRSWTLVELRSDLTRQLRRGLGEASRGLLSGGNVQIAPGAGNDALTFQQPLVVTESGTSWGAQEELGWRYRLRVDERGRLVRELLDGGAAVQGEPRVLALHVGPGDSAAKGFSAGLDGTRVRLVLAGRIASSEFAVEGIVETEILLRNQGSP